MATKALDLLPDEKVAFSYLFAKADTDQLGVLVGDKAVAFFAHSKLPPTVLGEIWQLADDENAGFLTRHQFDVALRLIGKAQRGVKPSREAIVPGGPVARFEGYQVPGIATVQSPATTGVQQPVASTGAATPSSLAPLTADDRTKYARLFETAGPVDGLLDGDKARDIFIKSRLPFDKLGQIWTLADSQQRGSLSVSDFSVAMHLIQLTMSGRLTSLPATLPPNLVQSASSAAPSQPFSGRLSQPPSRAVSAFTPARTSSSALGTAAFGGPSSPTPTGNVAWAISEAEVVQSGAFFDQLDTAKHGAIPGDKAVPFLMESKLPGDVLAHVWDLSDIRGQGALNRDEFAVAMRLIQDKLSGQDLPPTLPLALVPPSLRGLGPPASQPQSSAQQDLLSLMDDDPEPASPPVQAVPGAAKAFAIAPQSTGASLPGSVRSAAGSPVPQNAHRTVLPAPPSNLGGVAPRAASQGAAGTPSAGSPVSLDDAGAKLGNIRNQLTSTDRSLTGLRSERTQLESHESSTLAQISEVETRLAAARASHQAETKHVSSLRTRQGEQSSALAKLKEELIRAESDLSALRLEKADLEGVLLRDKEDVRNMKAQMQALNEETVGLKSALEAVRKEARQQKGLVAIGKKQVSTTEAQRDQASRELETAREAAASPSEAPSQPTDIVAPAEPSRVTSPTLSVVSARSTNPFERMLSGSAAAVPEPRGAGQSEELPAAEPSASSSPPPPAVDEAKAASGGFDETFGFADSFAAAPTVDHAPAVAGTAVGPPEAKGEPFATQDAVKASHPPHPPSDGSEDESSDDEAVEEAIGRPRPHEDGAILHAEPSAETSAKFPPVEEVAVATPAVNGSSQLGNSSMPGGFPDAFGGEGGLDTPSERVPTSQSRRAPPLPPTRSSTLAAKATDLSPAPPPAPAMPSADAGDMTTSTSVDDFKDFESSFADASFAPAPSTANAAANGLKAPDFAAFDESFDDTFGSSGTASAAPPAPQPAATHPKDDFAESFAAFDNKPDPSVSAPGFSETFAFDDTFGDPAAAPQPTAASKAPALPSRTTSTGAKLTPPKDSDSAAVHQICAMGFSREVAIRKLEEDDFDVSRAINHLLGA